LLGDLPFCTFDLGWCDRDAIIGLQYVVGRDWLSVDPDKITRCCAVAAGVEKRLHGRASFDFQVVSKASAIIIDKEYFQSYSF
jgi:hypothetical protein